MLRLIIPDIPRNTKKQDRMILLFGDIKPSRARWID